MKANITKQIGKATFQFQVEGTKEVDTLEKAALFATIPDICGLCKSGDVELSSNKAKGFTFVKVKCLKCNARSQLGQYKDGGCFWKDFEVYSSPEKSEDKEEINI